MSWEDFPGPRHQEELQVAHEGRPTVEEQDRTHGAGIPAEDRGMSEREKYGGQGGN